MSTARQEDLVLGQKNTNHGQRDITVAMSTWTGASSGANLENLSVVFVAIKREKLTEPNL